VTAGQELGAAVVALAQRYAAAVARGDDDAAERWAEAAATLVQDADYVDACESNEPDRQEHR
jgi:hypothetical protein